MNRKSQASRCVPVTGGVAPPASLIRALPTPASVPANQLDRHLLRLLTLHPQVSLKFRDVNLDMLDDRAKQFLLDDINAVLGIPSASGR
jgi:hypothetical protein